MTAGLRRVLVVAGLCAGATGCSMLGHLSGHRQHVFVSNYKDDTVSVIDGETNREVKVIAVGDSPYGLAARQSDALVAVANSTGKRVTFIDPVKLEVVRTVELGEITDHVAFSPDGKLLFVTLPKVKKVAVVDVDSGTLMEPIILEHKPKRLAPSPDGRRLYVLLHSQSGGVAVVDLATRTVETTVPTASFPTDFGLTRDGKRLIAASFNEDIVTVIDTTTLQPIATWPVGTGIGLIVHPTKPIAYSMASFDGEVEVLNYETGAVVATLEPGDGPTYSAISPDGRFLYVVNQDSSNVAKYDTETNQRIERVAVGGDPINAVVVDR